MALFANAKAHIPACAEDTKHIDLVKQWVGTTADLAASALWGVRVQVSVLGLIFIVASSNSASHADLVAEICLTRISSPHSESDADLVAEFRA